MGEAPAGPPLVWGAPLLGGRGFVPEDKARLGDADANPGQGPDREDNTALSQSSLPDQI